MQNNPITYSLVEDQNSNRYYQNISTFTDIVVAYGKKNLDYELKEFCEYLSKNGAKRTEEEHLFDFLLLGVLWNVYSKRGIRLNPVMASILDKLFLQRQKRKSLKPYIDKLRGTLFTLFMNKTYANDATPDFSSENFQLLIKWLRATGEFKEEVKRLELIFRFIQIKEEYEQENIIHRLVIMGKWFILQSKSYLSNYTENVQNFIEQKNETYKYREDFVFTGREEVEYHLNMTGAEIMNRAFKNDFSVTKKKVVLLPACMRKFKNEKCRAVKNDLEYVCTGCSYDCNINRYKNKGFLEDFEVRIIPHSSDFTNWIERTAKGKNIGVVGVACVLNLIQGGFELKELDIPAQCILLDYCGCQNHWHEKGIPTNINTHQLSVALCK